jgi:transcriptional regulator with XRE-family HTH domain
MGQTRSEDPRHLARVRLIGSRLMKARKDVRLSQGKLARLLNVDRNTVFRAEHGQNEPSITMVAAWARACGVTVDSILEGYSYPSFDSESPEAAE